MAYEDLLALLVRARAVLEGYLFESDGQMLRDDLASLCMATDDALPQEQEARPAMAQLERSAA